MDCQAKEGFQNKRWYSHNKQQPRHCFRNCLSIVILPTLAMAAWGGLCHHYFHWRNIMTENLLQNVKCIVNKQGNMTCQKTRRWHVWPYRRLCWRSLLYSVESHLPPWCDQLRTAHHKDAVKPSCWIHQNYIQISVKDCERFQYINILAGITSLTSETTNNTEPVVHTQTIVLHHWSYHTPCKRRSMYAC